MSNFCAPLLFLLALLSLTSMVGCSTRSSDQPQPRASAQPADTRAADEAAIRAASAAWNQGKKCPTTRSSNATVADLSIVEHGRDTPS